MTIEELKELEDILTWARGKAHADSMYQRIMYSLNAVRNEARYLGVMDIRIKELETKIAAVLVSICEIVDDPSSESIAEARKLIREMIDQPKGIN